MTFAWSVDSFTFGTEAVVSTFVVLYISYSRKTIFSQNKYLRDLENETMSFCMFIKDKSVLLL